MSSNTLILTLSLIQSLFSLLVLIFHVIGIYLLRRTFSYTRNQKLYLIQKSIMEIMFLIVHNNIILYFKVYNLRNPVYCYVSLLISCLIAIPYCNIVVLLSFDRFAQVWLNIKYTVYVTNGRANMAVVLNWIFGSLFCIVAFSMQYAVNRATYLLVHAIVNQFFIMMVVIVSVPCYLYIYCKVRKNKKSDNSNAIIMRRCISTHNRHRMLDFVPFWICFIFFVFIFIPNLFILFSHRTFSMSYKIQVYFAIVAHFFYDIGILCDVLIYIFMNKALKCKFLMLVQRRSMEWGSQFKAGLYFRQYVSDRVARSENSETSPM